MTIAIRAVNLGKAYQISHRTRSKYSTLQEDLIRFVRQPFAREQQEQFWALKDVSFEVQAGESLGIIGRNGAGKSTLLKILSRITKPSAGYADVYGRLGSLLEVGTGFHPELTGHENIFLNGAILGMTRRDIQRRYDEIVAFAEVEQFLDTPVKRYSSGMYMRLAFAVAAHLEPEILVVDEVLSVGDAKFQEKCLGKMEDIAQEGRTILFVSHNLAAIQHLCTAGIVLEHGCIVFSGSTKDSLTFYTQRDSQIVQGTELQNRPDRKGDSALRFTKVVVLDADSGNPIEHVLTGQNIKFRLYYQSELQAHLRPAIVSITVLNMYGLQITNLNTRDLGIGTLLIRKEGYFECLWPRFNFRSGIYNCGIFCSINGDIADWIQSAFQLQVEDGDFYHSGSLLERAQSEVLVDYSWKSEEGSP